MLDIEQLITFLKVVNRNSDSHGQKLRVPWLEMTDAVEKHVWRVAKNIFAGQACGQFGLVPMESLHDNLIIK